MFCTNDGRANLWHRFRNQSAIIDTVIKTALAVYQDEIYSKYILLILVRKFMSMDVWISVTVHAVNDMEGKKV